MKKMVLSAILGSLITLGGYTALQKNNFIANNTSVQTHQPTIGNTLANFIPNSISGGSANVPFDFTQAASKTMPSVVHIKSTENAKPASQRGGSNPFGNGGGGSNPFDFFGNDFDFFFGNPFGNGGTSRGGMQPQPKVGTGSGVIISPDGYIVTNNHVVEGADEMEVTLYDKQTYIAKVIGYDPSTDLALIKIDASNLPALILANSDEARVGEWVLAVGNPFNLTSTVTAGIVSAKGRNISILKDKAAIEAFIQTDAAVNPGNSGGALVNVNGELLGINTAIATPTGTFAGYSFAVPANIVKKVVDDLMKYGVVQRGFLGISITDVNGELAKEKQLDVTQGVYVNNVNEDGSAKAAGIQAGDVIVKIDGKEIKSAPELQEMVARHRPGDAIGVTIDRKGKLKDINVTLKNKKGSTDVVTKDAKSINERLGAEFNSLNSEEAQKLGLKNGIKVTNIANGSKVEKAGIEEGFVITRIDRQPISGIDDLEAALQSTTEGVLIEGIYPGYRGSFYYGINAN